jgi:hypothetical protein
MIRHRCACVTRLNFYKGSHYKDIKLTALVSCPHLVRVGRVLISTGQNTFTTTQPADLYFAFGNMRASR